MPSRRVLILDKKESPWFGFLKEFFEDTPVEILTCHDSPSAGQFFDQKGCDMGFFNASLFGMALPQKLKAFHQSYPQFRMFHLGSLPKGSEPFFQEVFETPESLNAFQKRLIPHLVLPEHIRLLVVDDEPEIGAMIREFLENRTHPSFEVDYRSNGKKGLEALENKKYDLLVLDIKMPEMDGRDLYREIQLRKLGIPVIIFFDAITGDEITEIHKNGRPPIVEKGSRQSAMPEMMALMKKMIYFG